MSTAHDDIFRAMADPSRRRILSVLCHQPHEAGELARLVGLAPNAISFHLRALKAADLVTVQRDGRFLRYSIEPQGLQSWLDYVDNMFPFDRQGPRPQPAHLTSHHPPPEPLHVGEQIEPFDRTDQLPTELL